MTSAWWEGDRRAIEKLELDRLRRNASELLGALRDTVDMVEEMHGKGDGKGVSISARHNIMARARMAIRECERRSYYPNEDGGRAT